MSSPTVQDQLSQNSLRHEVYSVWSPAATSAYVYVEGEDPLELQPGQGGWWISDRAPVVGERYRYSTDLTTKPFPDPRSRFQPEGIHGPSEVVDRTPVAMGEYRGAPLAGHIIYELHVGTFSPSGTFQGVIDRLDYLTDLGITAIELMPVNPFGGARNWGYDGVDWMAVHAEYGDPSGLKALVAAAHERGIAVILDVVFNHFGPDGNYAGAFGPYTQAGNTGWGDVVNMSNEHSDEVRALILDACHQWFSEFGIDGLRLDAIHAFDDRGATSIIEQIRAVASEVEQETGVPRYVIAESDLNDPAVMTQRKADAQWVDDIHHSLHALTSGERQGYYFDYAEAGVQGLAKSLAGMYFFDGNYSTFRRRHHGRPITVGTDTAIEPWQGVTYTTTHDQTGNRALGDRPSQYLDEPLLKLRAATVLCSPYTPMLFQGEEYAAKTPFPFFCSHESPELNRLTSEGRRREFADHGWDTTNTPDPAAYETFASAKLQPERNAIFAEYQRLIALRKRLGFARTTYPEFRVTCGDSHSPWLIMEHPGAWFVGNFSPLPLSVEVAGSTVALPAWGYEVLEK